MLQKNLKLNRIKKNYERYTQLRGDGSYFEDLTRVGSFNLFNSLSLLTVRQHDVWKDYIQ